MACAMLLEQVATSARHTQTLVALKGGDLSEVPDVSAAIEDFEEFLRVEPAPFDPELALLRGALGLPERR